MLILARFLSSQLNYWFLPANNVNSLPSDANEIFKKNSRTFEGQFLETCAQLLRPAPNFLTNFSGDEVEHQKKFLTLNFFTRKSRQKVGAPGAIVLYNFQEIDPREEGSKYVVCTLRTSTIHNGTHIFCF